jgi:multisubunit Na+/H+ antiporter MnhG subunit
MHYRTADMIDALQKLFGSGARVKLLRLFLFNPKQSFTIADAAARARVSEAEARAEVALFERIGLIEKGKRGNGIRYVLSGSFEYVAALQNLLLNAPERSKDIYTRVRDAGGIKFLSISGIFLGDWDGRLDLFIVGDRMNERKLKDRIRGLESELGKEIRYARLSTEDFLYRLNMNDKLVRDVLDYPHTIIVDKLNIGLK